MHAAKHDDLGSTPRLTQWKETTDSYKLSSDLCTQINEYKERV